MNSAPSRAEASRKVEVWKIGGAIPELGFRAAPACTERVANVPSGNLPSGTEGEGTARGEESGGRVMVSFLILGTGSWQAAVAAGQIPAQSMEPARPMRG